jgi:alkylated DNA repair dioxygenase AlkB
MVTPDLAIDRAAPRERISLGDGASWVDVVTAFVPAAAGLFDDVRDNTRWQQTEVLRYERYAPEKRLSGYISPSAAPPAVRQTGLHLESVYRQRFDGVAAILYRDGNDFQGLHSDREMRWLEETLIGILVLGERRPFVLRQRGPSAQFVDRTPAGQGERDVVLLPGHGDLLVMGGRCQLDWLHGVPAAATEFPRISLTWRWTSRRGRPDTNPGYYDGKQFSDRPRQQGSRQRPA